MIPHNVTGHINLRTGEVSSHQCTPKEDALIEIRRQPFGFAPIGNESIIDFDNMPNNEVYERLSYLSRQ